MWRFYVAATAIVAAFVFAVASHRESPPDLKVSARASGTPTVTRAEGTGSRGPSGALFGDAPWALSALPDCARQHAELRGPARAVRAAIPAGAVAVVSELHAGPCTIDVTRDGIVVTRGGDRLRIPPPARLLRSGDRYYLYREEGKAAELRVYSLR
ncbi:MAG: hypothetical protein JO140_01165 [Candidatus Eremiobacteraeota bacterium]|nr:hypothetical protein [Candidatus Eremiobacteraeota bacterium]